ncbi:MAG: beta-propeller domain-containing protein [Defluviitaleaceae bacterium]|nr:beta-propeller domain-containing protein [Defluviitaleaceae bacterium]
MKKILSVITAFIMLAGILTLPVSATPTAAILRARDARLENSVVVALDANLALVNGGVVRIDENRTVAPIIDSADRTQVPLRFISEAFNVEVVWDSSARTAYIIDGDTQISFRDGEIHYGRLFVPISEIAEALQMNVFFDRGLIIISPHTFDAVADRAILDAVSDMIGVLPTVGNAENFESILDELFAQSQTWDCCCFWGFSDWDDWDWDESDIEMDAAEAVMPRPMPAPAAEVAIADAAVPAAPAAPASPGAEPAEMPARGAGSADFSETNVQVQGVDESDVVKTDGEFIYYLRSNGELVISRAYPVYNMEVLQRLQIRGFSPREMYVDGDDLVLIGSSSGVTEIYIYSIADVLRNGRNAVPRIITIEGNYLSSRKIGPNVYVTANLPIRRGRGDWSRVVPDEATPFYSDRVGTTEVPQSYLSLNQIRKFPDPKDTNYLIVAAFNIRRPEQRVNVSAYIGAGEKIFMSHNNLYVARWNRGYVRGFHGTDGGGQYTVIYRFGLGEGRLTFSGSGKVDGTVLNQWSMDEHNGYFRIATTRNWYNFVFVLNEDLEIVGEIRDIAPTERIYSARFMGDTLYMVTFFIVDPFFVIDLSDPYNPRVLGELKIPGYSDYLHPFGENLILGIGKDTIERGGIAWEQGLRMTMFDVSDFYNPVDLFYIIVGGRGSTSEALRNPRAFLINPDRNLIAFPATIHGYNDSPTQQGPREFQGGLIFGADFGSNEFYLRGTITHQAERTVTGVLGNDVTSHSITNARALNRMLYIGDFLYGMSDFGISAHEMRNIEEINRLEY